ncbi:MAG: ROK family protein [Chloroflexota bacterium]|nr:ROK family protein [Chloroflexota bacterium]
MEHSPQSAVRNPQSAIDTVLGVDLGGTHVRAAAIGLEGRILARRQLPTDPAGGLDAVLDRLATVVAGAAVEAGVPPDAPTGVALPGPIDPRTGMLGFAPNLGWRDVPVRDLLRERLDRPVVAGNDANAAALGEWRYGAGRGAGHLVFLICGTGVGGGVIADGRLLLGKDGLAAELGHMVVTLDGPRCHCGGRGCLEAHAAGWAIARDAQRLLDVGMPSVLPDLLAERGGELSGALVTLAAQQDDGLALEVLARAGHAMGIGIASLVHIFDPEIVVIGGGVIGAGDLFFGPLREALDAQLMAPYKGGVRVVPSALGQDAGLLGAGALARSIAD